MKRRAIDVYALTSRDVLALGAFVERAKAAGVRAVGNESALVVDAVRAESDRLLRLDEEDTDEGDVVPCGAP